MRCNGLIRAGKLCGMTTDQIEEATSENIYIAEQCMARPEVWRAIPALANKLKPGRTSGRVAAGHHHPRADAFSGGLRANGWVEWFALSPLWTTA